LGQSADGLGWIGSHKMDPWTTLVCCTAVQLFHYVCVARCTLIGNAAFSAALLVPGGRGASAGLLVNGVVSVS